MANRNHEAVAAPSEVFATQGGQWATRMLKAAVLEGKQLSAQMLRTLDTLRHEEWRYFDQALLEEAKIRLVGVADLEAMGLTAPVPNSLGKTVYSYEKLTDMDPASVSMDGRARTPNDKQEFIPSNLPLPFTHKDFFLNLRQLAASRNTGEPLDTTQVRTAGRVVAEAAESLLFNGHTGNFGGLPIYGYTTFPQRIQTVTFDGNDSWDDATKAGTSFLADIIAAKRALAANRMYGPYMVYVPADADDNLDKDFESTSANPLTIRERLLKVNNILGIKAADQLPTENVVVVQMTSDVIQWVKGETLQTIQWDEGGGFTLNFKAFQIAVPLPKADAAGRCGICHITKS